MKIAYLHRAPHNTWLLTVCASPAEFRTGEAISVAGKREARAYCIANHITPWNF